jgi:ATP-dependent DNA helicase RecG
MSPVDLQVKIFDNKITFYNPGTLYGNLTIDALKKDNYQANARNKLIAEAFYLTGDIEKYGSGLIRIRKELKEYPTMKMVFEEIPNGFLSTISYTKQKTSLIEDNVVDNVVEKERQIIGFMLKNEKITAKKIALALALTERTVQRYLKGM